MDRTNEEEKKEVTMPDTQVQEERDPLDAAMNEIEAEQAKEDDIEDPEHFFAINLASADDRRSKRFTKFCKH